MQFLKHTFVSLSLSVALMASAAAPAYAQEEKVLHVYNWSDYIAEDTLEQFEAKTGIKVVYDVFDSNEVLEAKLLAGQTGYDVVVPTDIFLGRQIKAGLFQNLDRSKLPNYQHLDSEIMDRIATNDPGNEHAIPYLWGTVGIGYNTALVEERMPDAPVNSWDLVFKPEIVSQFADCGVSLLDSPTDIMPIALNYLGYPPNSEDRDHLQAAEDLLASIRPYIRYFHSSQYINDLANGDICVTVGWSGDIIQAIDRAAEADQGVDAAYSIPAEGTLIWFDLLAIPHDAPHPENAHLFLDFLMRPQIIADITNYVYFPNGNVASLDYVADDIKGDPTIYPTRAVKQKLFANQISSERYNRLRTRTWTRIKTGQ